MYISDLKIHGFKSFAKKEDLQFGEGITAVVGPNGCGKTNIVDAIRWVLGEQKYSVLRSHKMEEVIFNGSKNMKPMGVCEVSLTVHNNKGRLPIEYNDVEIKRRVYRNGESEFFLNRNPCRLKDIFELFVDTGMGADSYSVIELKMIEQILSDSGNDRFRMFEEAAGINKYKLQRKASIRKFEMVKKDLERVDDIRREVEEKVKHLNLQLKRYKRYEKLQVNLKDSEISLGYLQMQRLEEESAPLKTKVRNVHEERESKTTQDELNQRELQRLQNLYKNQITELEALNSQFEQLKEERDSFNQDVIIWNEQSHSGVAQIDRLEAEKKANIKKIEQFENDLKTARQSKENLLPEISAAVENHKGKKEIFDNHNAQFSTVESGVELLQNKRWNVQKEKSEIDRRFQKTELLIEEKSNLKTEIQSELTELNETVKQLKKSLIKETSDLKALSQSLEKLEKTQKENEDKLEIKKSDLKIINENLYIMKGDIKSLQVQLNFYQNIIQTHEGFSDGTKYILEHLSQFPSVKGMLVDKIKIDKKFAGAVHILLGDVGNCLVVDKRKSVLELIKRLKENELGSVSFIPLDKIPKVDSVNQKLPSNPQIIGRVSDLIKYPKQLKSLVEFLLGNCLIVDNINEMDSAILEKWTCVDLHGMLSGNGFVKYQKINLESVKVGRKDRLDELKLKLECLKNDYDSISRQKETSEKEISFIKSELSSNSDKLLNTRNKQNHITRLIEQNNFVLQKNEGQIYSHNKKCLELKNLISQFIKSKEVIQNEQLKHEKKLTDISLKLGEEEEKISNLRLVRDKLYDEVQTYRIEVLKLENKRENLRTTMNTAKTSVNELANRDSEIETEIITLKDKVESLKSDIEDKTIQIKHTNGKISNLNSKLDLKNQVKNTTYQDVENLQSLILSEQKSKEQLMDDMKRSEQKLIEIDQKKLIITQRLKELYHTNLPEYLSPEMNEEDLNEHIQKILRSIENIGAVNMAVQSDYDEEMERLKLLEEQRKDLIQSEENLRETIQKIDKIAREKFLKTFEKINENFTQLFRLFFEGGEGKLELKGDPDPLEADIAIRAQPPGKRNQHLRMLSAGEKSLTAIALLFAIYQYKPSPYCILDEVDAPLDDVNIHKFTRVLKQFSDETQFIVVTHNKLTMEAAHSLYGVTMEQKGVSKLVSVKFEA